MKQLSLALWVIILIVSVALAQADGPFVPTPVENAPLDSLPQMLPVVYHSFLIITDGGMIQGDEMRRLDGKNGFTIQEVSEKVRQLDLRLPNSAELTVIIDSLTSWQPRYVGSKDVPPILGTVALSDREELCARRINGEWIFEKDFPPDFRFSVVLIKK
ncbi:MAG: hypothetical protein COY66_03835 [Candidatus Kerfeldbacteria bacterium CG_4_10_14_0_8_um_filter_42_10]|uniref:Uncharacterized protein n=1 Tax=Candidatus Kerfeldbacteria bacterium CG_4_10_14_0_8_um_filter_42_10 TaxID=2014248 RepID=A0A2M7RJS7_9BACT|nr:MAG: hypothetical protein COY66_03835 [Candidatus Kerfeldbacteria bacterium CG_4_10_14_0_8_um_filter_42_10]